MRKEKIVNLLFGLIFLFFALYYSYLYLFNFVNSNYFIGIVTLFGAGFAICLYLKQKNDNKKDAAKIILQEIRRAENIIFGFKEHKQFKFTKKIIATNSWSKNVHYFVDDLSIDELDKISTLYSTGEYLDQVIKMVSDYKFDKMIHDNINQQAKNQVDQQLSEFTKKIGSVIQSHQDSTASIQPSNTQPLNILPSNIEINVNLRFDSISTDILFMQIVDAYEPIYHSDICLKFKKIAGIK